MFNLKSKVLSAAVSLPVVAAGLLSAAGSAEALNGRFSFDGDRTTATISNAGFNFTDPNRIELGLTTGDFVGDLGGSISDTLFASLPPIFINIDGDGKELTVSSFANPVFTTISGGVDISFNFVGVFEDGSNAIGNIDFTTFDFTNVGAAQIAYNGGSSINSVFKGVVVASVPEPTTMLGLGLVAAGMTVARRRKLVKA
ncbi:MAG: PEP-CTERM sorting domain-containing protein [Nostocales cyanobacterium]|nr:MAG: PEP-CTERM sorting domain-containing protein [Nostocales cyanobacterium]